MHIDHSSFHHSYSVQQVSFQHTGGEGSESDADPTSSHIEDECNLEESYQGVTLVFKVVVVHCLHTITQ